MSTRSYLPCFLLALAIIAAACTGDDRSNKFSDPLIVRIADLQDRRLADSLLPFLDHEDPVYRREAARAFASLQHTSDADKLGKLLLMDADASVRAAAAFALGQIDGPASERLLLAAIAKEKDSNVLYEVLNSYGKVTSGWKLKATSFLDDSTKRAGLAWSLYRAGLRGKTDDEANTIAAKLLTSETIEPRLAAAHYFARGARQSEDVLNSIVAAATGDSVADVRMAAALALGRIPSDSSLQTLRQIFSSENDTRVLVNAVRALRGFSYNQVKGELHEMVKNPDVAVASVAAEIIGEKTPTAEWIAVSSLVNWVKSWQVRSLLYAATLKASQRDDIAAEIRTFYTSTPHLYEKAAWLSALKGYPPARDFLLSVARESDQSVLRTSAAEAVRHIAEREDLTPAVRKDLATSLRSLITDSEDAAVIGILAQALASPAYRSVISDASFLHRTKENLELPKHVETVQALEAAIANLEDREIEPVVLPRNNPINWELVRQTPRDLNVTIHTTRGTFVIRLFVEEAPGTVANFIELARLGYFNEKPFHRVVPNFVVQTGCPRGDGWGSEDYSLRSEFSTLRFRTGIVGMASAGKDTEGTQWFVTHSPTPHLDGRYTAFAEVVRGEEVLNLLQIGDRVTRVAVEDVVL